MVNEFYTVDRSPREVLALWQWAQTQCLGRITRDDLYALGILATLEYLSSSLAVPFPLDTPSTQTAVLRSTH